MIIPLAICLLIGIILTLIAIIMQTEQALFIGIPYIIMSVLMIPLYGLFSMLAGLIYNSCAKKFGGLIIHIEDESDMEKTLQ